MNPDEPTTPPNATDEICPVCGAPSLREQHCKIICPNCGYTESCEDIFPVRPEEPKETEKPAE